MYVLKVLRPKRAAREQSTRCEPIKQLQRHWHVKKNKHKFQTKISAHKTQKNCPDRLPKNLRRCPRRSHFQPCSTDNGIQICCSMKQHFGRKICALQSFNVRFETAQHPSGNPDSIVLTSMSKRTHSRPIRHTRKTTETAEPDIPIIEDFMPWSVPTQPRGRIHQVTSFPRNFRMCRNPKSSR